MNSGWPCLLCVFAIFAPLRENSRTRLK